MFEDWKLIYSEDWTAGGRYDFGYIRFQKCVPSEGYREQTWRKKTIGSFIKCGSRQGRQESVHFGAVFIKIQQLGIL